MSLGAPRVPWLPSFLLEKFRALQSLLETLADCAAWVLIHLRSHCNQNEERGGRPQRPGKETKQN